MGIKINLKEKWQVAGKVEVFATLQSHNYLVLKESGLAQNMLVKTGDAPAFGGQR